MPTTAKETQYSANMIAQQVANQLWQRAQEIEDPPPVEQYLPPAYQHPTGPPPGYFYPPVPPMVTPPVPDQQGMIHQANAVVHDSTLKALMDQFKQLNTTVQNLQLQQTNQQYFLNQRNMVPPAGNIQQYPTTPVPLKKKRNKKYCWTHGMCNHDGFNCNFPAQGHNPYATKNNTMGGNDKGMKRHTQPNTGTSPGYQQNQYPTNHQQPPPYQQQGAPPPSTNYNRNMAPPNNPNFAPPPQQGRAPYGYPPRYP